MNCCLLVDSSIVKRTPWTWLMYSLSLTFSRSAERLQVFVEVFLGRLVQGFVGMKLNPVGDLEFPGFVDRGDRGEAARTLRPAACACAARIISAH